MSLVKWAFIGLLVLPAAEIVVFFVMAAMIGGLWATILLAAPSILGVMLLKQAGSREIARIARALRAEGVFKLNLDSPGVGNLLAIILLIIPGFITDVLGAVLMVPVLRGWAVRLAAAANHDRSPRDRSHPSHPAVIDLQPGEWHQVVDRQRTTRRKPGSRSPGGRSFQNRERKTGP
jgi:UPF0716 protein FxsA